MYENSQQILFLQTTQYKQYICNRYSINPKKFLIAICYYEFFSFQHAFVDISLRTYVLTIQNVIVVIRDTYFLHSSQTADSESASFLRCSPPSFILYFCLMISLVTEKDSFGNCQQCNIYPLICIVLYDLYLPFDEILGNMYQLYHTYFTYLGISNCKTNFELMLF